ncbi:hypothetical protein AVEN_35211-1 [Araneus ventricosus]|uniref:Uncharacterized protein n=1 Tax=Araneus ventricosus TaxID=182803 RepID=A0A4Y2U251_ARAVE|nr:hypothetical protein AVEN_35211-1 [Araneus ventricosus]
MVPKMLSPEQKEQCQTQCYHSGTPSLFSRPSTSGILPVSTAENEIEGTPFCGFRRGDRKCDEATEGPLKKWIPGVF